MKKTALINVVGLSKRLLGSNMPFLSKWSETKSVRTINPMLPGVTCSVQTSFLTGKLPSEHGIVGNGWYYHEEQEIKFWKQSNKLVEAESIWDAAKRINPDFTCANMFWWFNMYSSVDFSVTPRPQYRANGLKIPDCYSHPADLRDRLQTQLGTFPLFDFWGPKASIRSSEWIAEASLKVKNWHDPDLLLVYLPHLDYCMQKFGHDLAKTAGELRQIDKVCEHLITSLEDQGVDVKVISEYGITDVDNPIHINRVLRNAELLNVRVENGLEILDPGASKAFAVADHQIAHIYVNDPSCEKQVRSLLENMDGVAMVLDNSGKTKFGLDHRRSGDLIAVSKENSWFTYYYWLDDQKAPDFARTVDIHKKPGYDPVEMFLNPSPFTIPKLLVKVMGKKMGFRTLMDVIPLDAKMVKGSHGAIPSSALDHGVFMSDGSSEDRPQVDPCEIHGILLKQIV